MDTPERLKQHGAFGGTQSFYVHAAASTACPMRFAVYLPPAANQGRVPALLWLSGLTCTDENFTTKAGGQRYAADHGLALVVPDTSPRALGLPGETASTDFGVGASFYLDATIEPWRRHYRMATYVTEELPTLVARHFPIDPDRIGIAGHSMGGHGALVLALRNPGRFGSVSAFSPICAPSESPWGQKAFTGYLGPDVTAWHEWDASALLQARGFTGDLLVDQGTADEFLRTQLRPDRLEHAARAANVKLTLRRQPDYDHSYYFIATFIGDHIRFHAERLHAGG